MPMGEAQTLCYTLCVRTPKTRIASRVVPRLQKIHSSYGKAQKPQGHDRSQRGHVLPSHRVIRVAKRGEEVS